MSKSTRKKVVSILEGISDVTLDRFTTRYQCYATNPGVLRALVAGQLTPKTDLAVRVHVWSCNHCRREYSKLKAQSVGEAGSPALDFSSKNHVLEENIEPNIPRAEDCFPKAEQPQTTSREDGDFCDVLKQVLSGQQSVEALLSNSVFIRRLRMICRTVTHNAADVEELSASVCLQVLTRLNQFEPRYEPPHANFFGWVTCIARNQAMAYLRHKSVLETDDRLPEMYNVPDKKSDVLTEAERREAVERFFDFLSRLDPLTRKIMQYHLEDYSLEEIAKKLAEERMPLSRVAIQNRIREAISSIISKDAGLAIVVERKGGCLSRGRESGSLSARKISS